MTTVRNGRPRTKKKRAIQYWMALDGKTKALPKGEKGAIPCK